MPTKMLLIGEILLVAVFFGGPLPLSAQVHSYSNAIPSAGGRYEGLPPGSIILHETVVQPQAPIDHSSIPSAAEVAGSAVSPVPVTTTIATPSPAQPVPDAEGTADDDSDPNCCLQPGSENWERMVELIRENARLEAAVDKVEQIADIRQEIWKERLGLLEAQLAEQETHLHESAEKLERRQMALAERAAQVVHQSAAVEEAAEQLSSRKKELAQAEETANQRLQQAKEALLNQQKEVVQAMQKRRESDAAAANKIKEIASKSAEKTKAEAAKAIERINELESQMSVTQERAGELAKELDTTKEHLETARKREQEWKKERERMQQELKKGRKRS